MNWSADPVVLVPVVFVTVMSTLDPELPAGDTAVICVSLLIVKLAAAVEPNDTPVVLSRFVPVMVTVVPPAAVPAFGETPVTVGAGSTAMPLRLIVCVPAGTATRSLSVNVRAPFTVPPWPTTGEKLMTSVQSAP